MNEKEECDSWGWTRGDYERRDREILERRVEEHNASIIPDRPGYVRTSGPRRQYRASIRAGHLHFEEI